MRLIYNKKEVIFKVVHQSIWWLPRSKSCQMSGVVLNSRTESRLFHHFYIKIGSLGNSLCFDQLIFTFKIRNLFFHFFKDCVCSLLDLALWYNVMRCRKNRRMFQFIVNLTGQHIYFCNSINLISKEFHTNCPVRIVGREDFQHISTYPERTTMEIHFITVILNINQFFDYLIPVFLHSRTK